MPILLSLIVFFTYASTPQPTRTFFESIAGTYIIERTNNDEPHGTNSIAEVVTDDSLASLAMPYCLPGSGSCDPGYIDLELSNTTVQSEQIGEKIRYEIKDGDRLYYWEVEGNHITFENRQYQMPDGKITTLVHHLINK